MALVKPLYKDVTVVVSGGVGTGAFDITGKLDKISIIPNVGGTYDIDLADSAGHGIAGRTGLSGQTTSKFDTLCIGTNTLTISNATAGSYSVRLFYEAGDSVST